ncbi:MAG: formylmethanofuran--tetrahydromethanopterin N-formyltransferase [Gammaproteobacteria bacterium]|nr:formylmethanofuran--tetrahydromethanopterin N-formyltransferase [Gammaproteobacteria bacterium]NIN61959.1 formylmethanofuran--tetrahydromethanopterin N-formyltransferase [Gammaproteobacteria bacterium]NIO62038.1 formylmethanofuran--tetrahydromethanopterin N-formyltransferase [Gammaproteobacteria bacterium]NIQ08353.1 formylmethanofuran--tetrahydromethanopterin N-formyltransferase [Gammaproteobacteria bacterium]NIQ19750.1 formylmethanofuran--tetrahydromethanopterin N-formyltransferase [Gammapr
MKINGVTIDDTFAEAFPMKATRIIITAMSLKWAYMAANSIRGFASSVIACGIEGDIERELLPEETPDGRPGISVMMFAMSKKDLDKHVPTRVGQSVMTTATTACYAGIHSEDTISLGKSLRYFGDGYQISKVINRRRFWRIPVMHGEFICEETTGIVPAIGGGNFLVLAKTSRHGLAACEKAVEAIKKVPGVITAFPGGVVGSGSKVGSKYKFLGASTNEAYCPTLKGQVKSELTEEIGSVLEIVIDGLTEKSINDAMRIGIKEICKFGTKKGIYRVSAGNYGGNLGPYHFHLRNLLK